jgi:hypothetical protein
LDTHRGEGICTSETTMSSNESMAAVGSNLAPSTTKKLLICQANVQSLQASYGGNGPTQPVNSKLDEIQSRLCNELKFDIICLTETWLKENVEDEVVKINGYSIERKDRPSRGGGVAIYFKDTLPIRRRQDLEHSSVEILWVELMQKPCSTFIGVCYRPPNQTTENRDQFIEILADSITKFTTINHNGIFIVGDFNDRRQSWSRNHNNSELRNELFDLVDSTNMTQIINEPTHYTEQSFSLLDLIITDSPGDVSHSGTLPPIAGSDHCITHCTVDKYFTNKSYKRQIWDYECANWEKLNQDITNSQLTSLISNSECMDTIYDDWNNELTNLIKENIPTRTVLIRSTDKPWFTSEVKQTIRHRDRLFKKFKQTHNQRNYQIYRQAKFEARLAIDEAKANYCKKIADKLSNPNITPKEYWKIQKLLGKKSYTRIPSIQHNQENITKPEEKADVFNTFFASQCTAPLNQSFNQEHIVPKVSSIMHTFTISEHETQSTLRKLKTNKANGHDNMSNTILKNISWSITPSLTMLMNKSLELKQYPEEWKKAHVVPIHKKNSKHQIQSYRPISLLSNISKVMEKIIHNRLHMYLIRNNLLTWRNSGFKTSDGTVYQLVNLTHQIYTDLDNGEDNCMVFLDVSKAFDKVWHK